MRPRDFLKLGQLYLNFGVWNERRIVSRTWVEESTTHRITVPDGSSDGYGWHRHTLRVGDRSYQQYEASGNGGQFLMVVPELQLTIVITGGNYNQYQIWKTFREHIVPRYVLTAVIS